MSDNLQWMNRHGVLLREQQWAGLAEREHYKIRADLRPLFDAHPDSLDLLDALAERGLYREGCEFIARMTHRRAAIWWGYLCLLDLWKERREASLRPLDPNAVEKMACSLADKAHLELPQTAGLMKDIDNACKLPKVDLDDLLKPYRPPPQDQSAILAASQSVGGKVSQLNALIPDSVKRLFAASRAKADELAALRGEKPARAIYEEAMSVAKAGPLTYVIDRRNSPHVKMAVQLQDELEKTRQEIVGQLKAALPEKFPATPEAKLLLAADAKRRSDDAVQAVWRWIVSPDERNTTLAMAAGRAVPGTSEGLLAFAAAWSFGDLAPEGKVTVPVPPELPGTGLNSVLLMLALDQKGHRKMPERYERYFKMGMDVVFGRSLWTEAVSEKLSPHAKLEAKFKREG